MATSAVGGVTGQGEWRGNRGTNKMSRYGEGKKWGEGK